jgi:hypothetical protein
MSVDSADAPVPVDLDADAPLDDGQLTFNGVNGSSGTYLLPRQSLEELARLAMDRTTIEKEHADDLRAREQQRQASYATRMGVDERDLAEAGWGAIFTYDADPAIREALRPLLDHRRAQAARQKEGRYRELTGPDGYRPGESKNAFITRLGSAPGPVNPDRLPYYLLIVGDPEAIPFGFQCQLDVPHAVGRIHFDTPEEYAQYARSVVEAETAGTPLPRRATFVGVENPDDQATSLSARYLVGPLAQRVASQRPAWQTETVEGPAAVKGRLAALLGGSETPGLLFTASHGVGFDNGDPHQLTDQGALLGADWPGPLAWPAGTPLSRDHYLAAADVADGAALHGLIAFHFACYGAGTPRYDEFAHRGPAGSQPAEIAPRAFLAGLPKRLLGHPKGGALAVVGHVERAWGCSYLWGGRRVEQIDAFEEALLLLLDGYPLGAALEALNQRYAECATTLGELLERNSYGLTVDSATLVSLWTANNDARGYAVLGDPAVRLVQATSAVGETGSAAPRLTGIPQRVAPPPSAPSPGTAQPPPPAPRPPASIHPTVGPHDPHGPASGSGGAEHPPLPEGEGRGEGGPPSPAGRGAGGEGTGATQVAYGPAGLDERDRVRGRLDGALRQLGERLATALAEATTLTVTTYVGGDLAQAAGGSGPVAGARPVAVTRIGLLGDAEAYVPSQPDAVDAVTWARHMDHVGGVQARRAALLAATAEAAASLARLLHPG